MKNNRKEFIKDLHSNVNDYLKEQIELEFPKLFKKDDFIVGEWYKNLTHKGSLFCFRYKDKYTLKGEGFDYLGVYYKRGSWHINNKYIKATEKEVFEALKKEAIKRGFKEGVSFYGVMGAEKSSITKIGERGCLKYDLQGIYCGNSWLLYNGIWANPIVETITKEEAEKQLGKTIVG